MDCRRALQLDYFGEHFTREQCLKNKATACDNCSRVSQFKEIDATDTCKMIVSAVKDLCMERNRFTVLHMVEVFKGGEAKKIVDSGHNNTKYHGYLKTWDRSDIQRIFHKLIIENYLREEIIICKEIPQSYLKIGINVQRLMTPGKAKHKIMFAVMEKNQPKAKKVEVVSENDQDDVLQDNCYHELMEVAQVIAEEKGLTVAQVMNMQAIREMSKRMPEGEAQMLQIPHVTKANFDKFGQKFLNVTIAYSAQRALNALDSEELKDDFGSQSTEHEEGTDWQKLGREASTSSSVRRSGGIKRKIAGGWGKAGSKKFKASGSKKTPVKKAAGKARGGASGGNLMPRPRPQF